MASLSWRVALAYLNPDNQALPLIEGGQVNEYYFVKDGKHLKET